MSQQIDIVANLLMKVDGAESGLKRLQNSLSGLKLPKGLDSDLKKSMSNLEGLFATYRKQIEKGFDTKSDVSAFTKTAKSINAEYDRITRTLDKLNNTNVTFNIKSDSIKKVEQDLDNIIKKRDQLSTDAKTSIAVDLANIQKAGSRSTKVQDYSNMLGVAIDKGQWQEALRLAQLLKTQFEGLSDKTKQAFATMSNGKSATAALDDIIAACRKGGEGFDKLEKEGKEAAELLASLQAKDLEQIEKALAKMGGEWQESTNGAKALNGEMTELARSTQSMSQQLGDLQQSTQYFFSLRNMINLLKRGISDAIQTVKELDAAMTETAVVTDFSVGDMWAKLPEYTANANALGASVKDMYEATTLYYQQGLRTEAAMGIANETMKMARIGGLDAADATDKMTAALRGFNMEINEASAQRVNDVYSNLAAKTASDTEELGTAMQRTASIAASAGMSFEGTAAFLAQAIETTREPAENLGTAMKTIVARFTELKKNPLEITEVDGEEVSYNKVDTALQSIGVSLKDANGQFRDLDKVFLDISKRWDSLTQTQQRYVATTAAGSRQQSRFIAMMSNYERTVQLMDFANNSAGASNEQFGKTMESLEAKLNKLKNAWNEFLMGIMNDSWTKKIVDGTTTVIDRVNDLINLLSGGGKLKGVKSFLSLFTAFMGLRFAGGLANFGIGKLGKLVDPTAKKGALNLGGDKGIAGKITTPIVAKLNELIAVTKGQKTSDKAISSTLAGYKNAANLLRMPQTIGTMRSTFGQLSDEHAYAAYINSPGTASAMKSTAMQWLSAKQLDPEMQKTGEQLMGSIFKGMDRKQIPIKKGTKLIGKPELWGEYLGTETAKSFSDNFIKIQKTREAQQAKQIADARKQAWARAGGDPYASDAVKELQYKTNANGIKDRYLQAYKQIRQQQKEAFGGSLNTKAVNPKPYEQLANRVGTLGSNFTAAGYSMQMFGAQLGQLSPGLADIGNLISRLGIAVSTFGMGFSGMGNIVTKVGAQITKGIEAARLVKYGDTIGALINSGQVAAGGMIASAGAKAAGASGAQVAGGFASGFLNGIPKPLLVAGLIAAVGGAILAIHKHIEKQAQEAGKKVRESFEENFTKSDNKINSLEEYKNRFNELSKGVDQFGHNINLSAEEYDEYLNISKELQQLSPSLIAGYNAEGEAIIKKGNAIQEVIDGLKKAKQEELDLFTKDSSINKLIGEYKTSDVYKNNHTDAASPINRGYSNFAQERIDIAELKDGDKLVNSINQLTGWNLNSLSNLTTSQLSWLSKHYSDVIGLVEEQNGKLSDEVKDGYIDAFANAGSAIDEVMTEGQPIIDAMQQWMGLEGIDAVGLGLGEEFGNSFNEGLQGIMLTGLSEGWSADTFKSNIRDYANEWDELAGSTSKYADIMEDAKDVQDEYLSSMGSDNAIQNYNTSIAESCNKLIELANSTDTATAAGQAFQQQCIAQANALRNYATEGGVALSQALNTATDDLQQAEGALDNFNEATKTDLYTAAEGMKSIYDKAFETYKDSFGGEYEKHFESKGDRTAWEAGRTILGEDALKSIPDGQALRKKLKEWEPALREGEEGWYNFWTKITGDTQLMDNLNAIDGVRWDEDDFYIPDDKWAEVAKTIGISEEMLTAMLNKGRQFADISFTNWGEARHTLETSGIGIEGTVGTEKNGRRKLFIKEETFEAALADANYKPEEYEAKKQEGREKQNLEYLKSANEYNSQQLSKIFREEMGISNLTDLISTLSASGDYTKDEIEAYAEKAGFKGDFDSIYDKVAEAIENPELYKQTSVLEKISSQIALLSEDNNITADDALSDRNKFAKELYGNLGKVIDSEADYFAHGQDKEGKKLTVEEYEATRKSLEAQKAWAEQQANMAQAKAANASNPEEQAKWLEVADKYAQDAENIGTYITMGIAAFEASEQEKSTLTQQATEQAKALVDSNASNDQIKASIQEAAQKMAEAKMKPEDIAAALNKSYGTNLEGKDINIGKDGQVDITLDETKLKEQLSNLHADVEANIVGIHMGGGHAAKASGQNNTKSAIHRVGTMARGSKTGYTIKGEPTLTGELGPELVWEPKQNRAYMVGEHGPQFANISKNAVVWNAKQTKKIQKNSKGVNQFGTGAYGIHPFGTMAFAEGAGGGSSSKISGLLNIDAIANIQDVVPPTKEFTIPIKADLKNQDDINNIKATAEVTRVVKGAQITGEPIKVKATATASVDTSSADKKTQSLSSSLSSLSGKSTNINITSNADQVKQKLTSLEAKANKLNTTKTLTVNVKKTGVSSISVDGHTWSISAKARGQNNHGYFASPSFGSAAKGNYGQLGPKGRGGLTLTGELGYEIAWIPSENRSMILGANGPQMINLPNDAVIWSHEQSKQILKQKAIPAGSQATAGGHYSASESRYSFTGGNGGNGGGGTTARTVHNAARRVQQSAADAAAAVKKVSVWWENIARKTELSQRIQDKNQKAFEKYLKEMRATLHTTGESLESGGGGGDDYLTSIGKTLGYYEAQLEKVNKELYNLANAVAPEKPKDKKEKYGEEGYENIAEISYKNGKKTKTELVDLAKYITEEDGVYIVDQAVLDTVKNKDQRKAIADAANKEINDRLSKKYKAEDEIEKAQEAIEKMGEELYNTFFGWETELTKIWNITQKIEQTEARISQFKGYSDLLESQLSTGMAKAGKDFATQSLNAFKSELQQQINQIDLSLQSIDQKRLDLNSLISLDDEKQTLTDIQNKLIDTIKTQDQIAKTEAKVANKQTALDNAIANSKSLAEQETELSNQIIATQAKIDSATKTKVRQNAEKQLLQLQADLERVQANKAIAETAEINAREVYEQAVKDYEEAKKGFALGDTEYTGYEQYAKELEKTIAMQAKAWEFMSVDQLADGTLSVNFDTDAFEAEKFAGGINEERGKAIQDYVKSIVDGSKELSQQYTDTTSLINDMYGSLSTLQDNWADYANELWDISEAEQKKEVDNAKKLSDTIVNALKDLLDEVKRKLDERRKEEDNAKTERDISQKQQRLAALRADTAGGHQVEIAQLEKEIADAQQSYQRSLEDQLLDKLQQQADLAAQQRERQIELQEATINEINNAAQVNEWMSDPERYRNEIFEAFKTANEYDKKPEALQAQLDNKFNTLFNGLLTNRDEQELVTNEIKVLEGKADEIKTTLGDFTRLNGVIAELAATITQTGIGGTSSTISKPSNITDEETTAGKIESTLAALNPPEEEPEEVAPVRPYGLVSEVSGDLKQGSQGDGVKALQLALNELGYTDNKGNQLSVDGNFGGLTKQAVIKFQKAMKLAQDGVVGNNTKKAFKTKGYKTGGLADYTGPAWLDGTPSKPELVLNSKDTQNFLTLRDVLSSAMKTTGAINNSYVGDAMYEININVDHLNNDYDVDKVAERVKKIIVKDSGYRNVTQVRNFR